MTKGQEIADKVWLPCAFRKDEYAAMVDAAIAEAVAAEREACAQVCLAHFIKPHQYAMGGEVRIGNPAALQLTSEIRARGKPPVPVWCEHIQVDERGVWRYGLDSTGGTGANNWVVCPIKGCGKPRPE